MNCLTLHKRFVHPNRINLHGIVPDRLQHLSLAEIEALPISIDGSTVPLNKQFAVSDGQRSTLILDGDLSHCDFIAGGMLAGEIVVEGTVGDFLAAGMRSGRVRINGDAGAYACSSLRGGQVVVVGNVGDYAAAAPPQAVRGMTGGVLVVHGSAGLWLASRMRRGLIVVHGYVAAGCASRMIAGTLAIVGQTQLPLGYGMARGTLFILDPEPQLLQSSIPGFTPLVPCELSILAILLQELAEYVPPKHAATILSSRWMRCQGDRAERGIGEVFMRLPALNAIHDQYGHA